MARSEGFEPPTPRFEVSGSQAAASLTKRPSNIFLSSPSPKNALSRLNNWGWGARSNRRKYWVNS
jgi:hypothetical protein